MGAGDPGVFDIMYPGHSFTFNVTGSFGSCSVVRGSCGPVCSAVVGLEAQRSQRVGII